MYRRNAANAVEYLITRGYPSAAVCKLDVGFASNRDYLQSQGFTKAACAKLGLLADDELCRELFSDRIVFAVRNERQQLTHFQARAIDANNKCKWLASKTTEHGPLSSALYNAHRLAEWSKVEPSIFLCEGISDALALECMGLPVIASFGIQTLNLNAHELLKNFNIVAVYDNDRYALGNDRAGLYKSWGTVLPQLAKIQRDSTKRIYTLDLPAISGVKDVFDFSCYLDWQRQDFLQFVRQHCEPLSEKICNTYGLTEPSTTLRHLVGLPLSEELENRLTKAILNTGGWLANVERAFY